MYTIVTIDHMSYDYDNNLQRVMYLGYDKPKAKKLLNNIFSAMNYYDYDASCLRIYDAWESASGENQYVINMADDCKGGYLPPNATLVVIDNEDETKVDSIYWQFNDDIKLYYYKDGKQADNFKYLYLSSMYAHNVMDEVKESFENDVKQQLLSPSSAIFTYNTIRYSEQNNTFLYLGLVESQNAYGAMVRTDFTLTLLPCDDNCPYYGLNYSWYFNNNNTNNNTNNNNNNSNNSNSNNNRSNNSNKSNSKSCNESEKQRLTNEYQTTLNQRESEYQSKLAKAKQEVEFAKESLDLTGGYLSSQEYETLYNQTTNSTQRELLKNRYNMSVNYDKMVSTLNAIPGEYNKWKSSYEAWYKDELKKLGC